LNFNKEIAVESMIYRIVIAIGLTGAAVNVAQAQAFPSKPVRIIVPYVAGGAVDASARALAVPMGDSIGHPVLVENRPGASSIIGMQACAKSPPDGYTMCYTVADSLSYNPLLFKSLPYDAEKDFVPVVYVARSNSMLLAKGNAPFNSFKEMVAYAKAKPGALNWGTWGPASIPDIYLAWIKYQLGLNITAVPYKGAGAAVPAALAGEVDVTFMTIGAVTQHLKAGKLKSLAVVGNQRSSVIPDVPALTEEGADPGLRSYFGMFAPGGTPRPLVERLNAEVVKALNTPKMQEFFRTMTLDIVGGTADQFAEFMKTDRANAARVFKTIGIQPTDAPQ
jgi:tripartite-type tricarboxylate transporter receptor subunit TctC